MCSALAVTFGASPVPTRRTSLCPATTIGNGKHVLPMVCPSVLSSFHCYPLFDRSWFPFPIIFKLFVWYRCPILMLSLIHTEKEMATIEFLKQTTKLCPWCNSGIYLSISSLFLYICTPTFIGLSIYHHQKRKSSFLHTCTRIIYVYCNNL